MLVNEWVETVWNVVNVRPNLITKTIPNKQLAAKKRDPMANKGGIERMEYSIARYVEPQTM